MKRRMIFGRIPNCIHLDEEIVSKCEPQILALNLRIEFIKHPQRFVQSLLPMMMKREGWRIMGYSSLEAYLRNGLGLDETLAKKMIEVTRGTPEQPVRDVPIGIMP